MEGRCVLTKPTKYSEPDARARFARSLNGAPEAMRKPRIMTATLKRRALRKKSKKAGKEIAIPAIFVAARPK